LKKKFTLITFALLLTFVGLVYFLYNRYYPSQVYPVIEGKFYRSGQLSAKLLEKAITGKGLKTIVNLRGKFNDARWYVHETELANKYHVKMYDIGLSPNDLPQYRKLLAIIDAINTAERPVLFHCNKGADRSGLVSALAVAMENDPPLSELKKQFSFRYGVFPFYRSTGPYFFSYYEQWLQKTRKTHNKENLLYWIRNEYQDDDGNLEFMIEQINTTDWKDFRKQVKIPGDIKDIRIRGWAFDAGKNAPPEYLHITFDSHISFKVDFMHDRPDVAEYFNLSKECCKNFKAGWEISVSREMFSAGCHAISFKYINNGTIRDVPADITFCL
jgi:protein tyrosine phosphatase (PTP) superfamily phosphohydrolase (DUF442 family)